MIKWKWRALKSAVRAWWFRIRHGFDYRDCWNLDYALAKWLAPRLKYLSQHAQSYPGTGVYESMDHGMVGWRFDLMKAAHAFEAYSKDREDFDPAEEVKVSNGGQQAIDWVAKWWRHLWD